jgi:hypothetical protein
VQTETRRQKFNKFKKAVIAGRAAYHSSRHQTSRWLIILPLIWVALNNFEPFRSHFAFTLLGVIASAIILVLAFHWIERRKSSNLRQ